MNKNHINDLRKFGVVHLKKVLRQDQLSFYQAEFNNLFTKNKNELNSTNICEIRNIIEKSPAFLQLIDIEPVFSLLVEIMGPTIQLCISQALRRPPGLNKIAGYIHTDGGISMANIHLKRFSKPLMIKVQYFLSKTNAKEAGNFAFVPNTHLKRFPILNKNKLKNLDENACQLNVDPGDVILFVNSLWHGVSKNDSDTERQSIAFGYNHLFMRPLDYNIPSDKLLRNCSPRQQRLLGFINNGRPESYYYLPCDQVSIIENIAQLDI